MGIWLLEPEAKVCKTFISGFPSQAGTAISAVASSEDQREQERLRHMVHSARAWSPAGLKDSVREENRRPSTLFEPGLNGLPRARLRLQRSQLPFIGY